MVYNKPEEGGEGVGVTSFMKPSTYFRLNYVPLLKIPNINHTTLVIITRHEYYKE